MTCRTIAIAGDRLSTTAKAIASPTCFLYKIKQARQRRVTCIGEIKPPNGSVRIRNTCPFD
jgi:hypothetical protein